MIGADRISAGELNRYVSVQSRAQTHDPDYGGQSASWAELSKVYAKIEGLYGRELVAAQAIATTISHMITVRYQAMWADPKVASEYRIVYGARVFDVNGVVNVDEGNDMVRLFATEGMSDG